MEPTPTASSTRYSSPVSVTATTTIKAIAVASGYSNSADRFRSIHNCEWHSGLRGPQHRRQNQLDGCSTHRVLRLNPAGCLGQRHRGGRNTAVPDDRRLRRRHDRLRGLPAASGCTGLPISPASCPTCSLEMAAASASASSAIRWARQTLRGPSTPSTICPPVKPILPSPHSRSPTTRQTSSRCFCRRNNSIRK